LSGERWPLGGLLARRRVAKGPPVDLLSRIKALFGSSSGSGKKPEAPKRAAAPKPAPPPPPAKKAKLPKIDLKKRFDLLRQLGQGSMSKVWQARDRSLGRVVCLKVLDKEKTAKFEERFKGGNKPSEGEICVQLRHPNIVQTFEHGMSSEGQPFVVMEMIEGLGLNYLVDTKSEKLNGMRIALLAQLGSAIGAVHAQGFLHRDICPRNVMLTGDLQVKLIDFGLSIPNTPLFCKPGNRTGTPSYLAPELIRRVTTDQRVDLFALGVTAYEVFTFGLPWEKAQSLQTLLLHMNTAGKSPIELVPDMDDRVRTFLVKAIARDPSQRFQSAAEFVDALKMLPPQ
jgi:serine/threonine protein kinase